MLLLAIGCSVKVLNTFSKAVRTSPRRHGCAKPAELRPLRGSSVTDPNCRSGQVVVDACAMGGKLERQQPSRLARVIREQTSALTCRMSA
jgi:hypothetical protein